MTRKFTQSDVDHVNMKTAKQHNAPVVGEIILDGQGPVGSSDCASSKVIGIGARQESPSCTVTNSLPDCPYNYETFVKVEPVAAPRMTRRDKWKKRPIVERYFAYRDKLRKVHAETSAIETLGVPDEIHLSFHITMPASWSNKKHARMDGKPHRQRPDKDNLCKGVLDALFEEDGGIWRGSQEKFWTTPGFARVVIRMVWHNITALTTKLT